MCFCKFADDDLPIIRYLATVKICVCERVRSCKSVVCVSSICVCVCVCVRYMYFVISDKNVEGRIQEV